MPLQKLDDLPKPHKEHLVKLREEPEQFYACVTLTGAYKTCVSRQAGLPGITMRPMQLVKRPRGIPECGSQQLRVA